MNGETEAPGSDSVPVSVRVLIGSCAALTVGLSAVALAKAGWNLFALAAAGASDTDVFLFHVLPFIAFAAGVGASVRALLGQDALAERDPETGVPTFSLRRAARELPAFPVFAACFLMATWGWAGATLAPGAQGQPGSVVAAVSGATAFLGTVIEGGWMACIALGMKRRT